MAAEWRTLPCSNCRGLGVVSSYTLGGTDFLGAKDCPECMEGVIYILPNDRLALWPGGPFRGSWPGGYTKATPVPKWHEEEGEPSC